MKRLTFWIRYLRWFFSSPFRLGDPLLGRGAIREKNRRILLDRYWAREPKAEGETYG